MHSGSGNILQYNNQDFLPLQSIENILPRRDSKPAASVNSSHTDVGDINVNDKKHTAGNYSGKKRSLEEYDLPEKKVKLSIEPKGDTSSVGLSSNQEVESQLTNYICKNFFNSCGSLI